MKIKTQFNNRKKLYSARFTKTVITYIFPSHNHDIFMWKS